MDQIMNMLPKYWAYLGVPLLFLAIVAWIYRPAAKRRYKADGNIPVEPEKSEVKKRENPAR